VTNVLLDALHLLREERDGSIRRRELDGVGEEIDENLAVANTITNKVAREILLEHRTEADSLLVRQRPDHSKRIVQQVIGAHQLTLKLHLPHFNLVHIEDVVDEGHQRFRARSTHLKQRLLLSVHLGQHKHFQTTEDAKQGGAELMGHARDELRLVDRGDAPLQLHLTMRHFGQHFSNQYKYADPDDIHHHT